MRRNFTGGAAILQPLASTRIALPDYHRGRSTSRPASTATRWNEPFRLGVASHPFDHQQRVGQRLLGAALPVFS